MLQINVTCEQLNTIIDALNYAAVNAATQEDAVECVAVGQYLEQTAKAQ